MFGIASIASAYAAHIVSQKAANQYLGACNQLAAGQQHTGHGPVRNGSTLALLCAQADSTGELNAQNPRRPTVQSADTGDSALRRAELNALKYKEDEAKEIAARKAVREAEKPRFVNDTHERIASGKERLSLKNSPLFGYMKWSFSNPWRAFELWVYRMIIRTRQAGAT